jgi:hypothetical protein
MNPCSTQLLAYLTTKAHLQREFGVAECWPIVIVEVAPHVQVMSNKLDSRMPTALGRAFWRYTPDEVASIQEDPSKRQRYVETYKEVLIPRLRDMKACVRTQAHLLAPSSDMFDTDMFGKMIEPALGMTRREFTSDNPRIFFFWSCNVS